MGKNKWYWNSEGDPTPTYRPGAGTGTASQKKANPLPSIFFAQKQDEPTFTGLLQTRFKRFKRKWLSIKFRSAQVSGSSFNKITLVKLGFLALAVYYFFGAKSDAGGFVAGGQNLDWDNETTLSVGAEKKRVKPAKDTNLPTIKNVKKQPKTDAEPVSREMLRSDQSTNYIKKFSRIARQEMHKYGIPASISLAQGLVESRAGTSKLAVNNNNHFGMKCFSRNCGKGHCSNHTDDTHKDFFLKFNNPEQSWRAHSILLTGARYAKLKKYGRDYRRWAHGLKNAGYATDKTYDKKLIGIIERYDLHQYDR